MSKQKVPYQIRAAIAFENFLEVQFEDGVVKRIAWDCIEPKITHRDDFFISPFGTYIEWLIDDITFGAETFYVEFPDKDLGCNVTPAMFKFTRRATRKECLDYAKKRVELANRARASKE